MITVFKLNNGTELMCECYDIEDGMASVANVLEVVTESVMTDSGLRLLVIPRLYSTHVQHNEIIDLQMDSVMSMVIADDISETYYGATYYGLLREEVSRRASMMDAYANYNFDKIDIHERPALIM